MSGARGKKGPTSFRPGQSGNPGGRPKMADIAALCRVYTVDAVKGLVDAARLNPAEHGSVVVAASRELLDRGYGKSIQQLDLNPLQTDSGVQHLLAVSALDQAELEAMVAEELGDLARSPAIDHEPLPGEELLPQPELIEPEVALLPLWDKRARAVDTRTEDSVAADMAAEPKPEGPADG